MSETEGPAAPGASRLQGRGRIQRSPMNLEVVMDALATLLQIITIVYFAMVSLQVGLGYRSPPSVASTYNCLVTALFGVCIAISGASQLRYRDALLRAGVPIPKLGPRQRSWRLALAVAFLLALAAGFLLSLV